MAPGPTTTISERPVGLQYQPQLVSEEEEQALVSAFEREEFSEVRMHEQPAKRTVLHFGYRYAVGRS